MNIKPKLVEKSSYTRKLEFIPVLESFLDQVKDYKAIRKLEELLYTKAEKGMNKYYTGNRKTPYSFSCYERYNRLEVRFSDWDNDKTNQYTLEFEVKEKTIPSIIEGLKEYKAKLEQWQSEENQVSVYTYGIEREIERMFDKEMTEIQFRKTKEALEEQLKELIWSVKELKAE